MKKCPDPHCPAHRAHPAPTTYRDEAETCHDCGEPLITSEEQPTAPRLPVSGALWFRLGVTLAVPILLAAVSRIRLPGLDPAPVAHFFFTTPNAPVSSLGILALGMVPLLLAFGGVELATLLVPKWQPLRTAGPAGRARLQRPVLGLVLVVAGVQAYSLALWLENTGWEVGGIQSRDGVTQRLLITLTLVAGVFLVWLAAAAISRFGLGNGFSVLIAAAVLVDIGVRFWSTLDKVRDGRLAPVTLLTWLAGLFALCYFAWRLFNQPRQTGANAPDLPRRLRSPATGSSPLEAAAVVIAILHGFMFPLLGGRGAAWLADDSWLALVGQIVLLAGFCLLFVILYNQPCRVARSWSLFVEKSKNEMAAQVKQMTRPALWHSGKTLLLVTLAAAALVRISGGVACGQAALAMIMVAVALDLRAEWQTRRRLGELASVWPLHRVYLVDVVVTALRKKNIEAYPRSLHHRTLLQFFGPFVPVEIMVPITQAPAAQHELARLGPTVNQA